jgi:hypothetical protein
MNMTQQLNQENAGHEGHHHDDAAPITLHADHSNRFVRRQILTDSIIAALRAQPDKEITSVLVS